MLGERARRVRRSQPSCWCASLEKPSLFVFFSDYLLPPANSMESDTFYEDVWHARGGDDGEGRGVGGGGGGCREEKEEFRTDRYDLIFLPFRLDKSARKSMQQRTELEMGWFGWKPLKLFVETIYVIKIRRGSLTMKIAESSLEFHLGFSQRCCWTLDKNDADFFNLVSKFSHLELTCYWLLVFNIGFNIFFFFNRNLQYSLLISQIIAEERPPISSRDNEWNESRKRNILWLARTKPVSNPRNYFAVLIERRAEGAAASLSETHPR